MDAWHACAAHKVLIRSSRMRAHTSMLTDGLLGIQLFFRVVHGEYITADYHFETLPVRAASHTYGLIHPTPLTTLRLARPSVTRRRRRS
jgi:hypothetical protein